MQTHEEATVYVKESDIFLTMKVLEDTPAVLSPGKLCDEHGYSYEWINGQKPHLIKNGFRIQWNTENFVPIVVPGLSTSSSSSLPSSTSMTPSMQENGHPTSSASSSTSRTTHWLKCLHERVSPHPHGHPCRAPECPFFDSLFLTLFLSVCFSYPFFFYLNPELNLFLHVVVIGAICHWHSATEECLAPWPKTPLSHN